MDESIFNQTVGYTVCDVNKNYDFPKPLLLGFIRIVELHLACVTVSKTWCVFFGRRAILHIIKTDMKSLYKNTWVHF